MSFKSQDLSVLAYANNFTLWHYTTPDDDITTSGYFDSASNMLRVNDLIIANFDTDGSDTGPARKRHGKVTRKRLPSLRRRYWP